MPNLQSLQKKVGQLVSQVPVDRLLATCARRQFLHHAFVAIRGVTHYSQEIGVVVGMKCDYPVQRFADFAVLQVHAVYDQSRACDRQ